MTQKTATPEPSPTPEETTPGPIDIIPSTKVYSSTNLGLSFTVPESWVGKYRVWESECSDCLTVYYYSSEFGDKDTGDGELFSIDEKWSELQALRYDYAVEFDLGDLTYICGTSKIPGYQNNQPEYMGYAQMMNDIPTVFKSIRTINGQMPDNMIFYPKPAPMNLLYTSKKLHIAFSMPDSWKGKYVVKDEHGIITVCFKPIKPLAEENGDGWLFSIAKKTSDTENWVLDYKAEVEINGKHFICGGPTDVSYEGEEEELFMAMANDIWAVFDTIRAAK